MSPADQGSPGSLRGARRAARVLADVVRECNYAQRRLLELRLFDRDGDHAPDTYAEFLFRSQAALWREPSARCREAGSDPHK